MPPTMTGRRIRRPAPDASIRELKFQRSVALTYPCLGRRRPAIHDSCGHTSKVVAARATSAHDTTSQSVVPLV